MNALVRKHIISLIFLILISTLLFSNTFKNSFIWDDKAIVTKGEYISKPGNIPLLFTYDYWKQFYLMLSRQHNQQERVNYRPIFMASFAFDYSLWKLNPFGYHLSNLLFHILNVILIYFLILNIVRTEESPGGFINLPFISALLFAIHPIHTESITWIKNRSDLLTFIFFLLSLILFIKFRFQNKSRSRVLFYCLSLFCFILALFSKSMAVTLPFILGLYIICFVPRGQYKSFLIKTLPFFGVMLIYIIFELAFLGKVGSGGDAVGRIGLYPNTLAVIKTVGYYFKLLILPFNLNAERPFSVPGSLFEPVVLFSLLSLLILTAIIIKAFRHSRVITFFILWIFLSLMPISNIIFLASRPIAEQRLYIPSLGFCVLLALGLKRIYSKRLALTLIMIIFISYSYITMNRNLDWRDSITFWTKTAEASPNSPRAYNNLGVAYYDKKFYQEALSSYNKAIEINPGYAHAYNNMGVTYRDTGEKTDEAISSFKKAIRMDPHYAEAYNNLGGVVYEDLNHMKEAIESYKKAVEIEPAYAEAYFNLGLMHDLSDDYEKAIISYQKAIELNPELGIEPYNNLAYIYIRKGRFDEAVELAKKALFIEPQNAEVLDTLGWAYYKKGAPDKALEHLKKAAILLPDNAEIHEHLEAVYDRQASGEGKNKGR